MAARQHLRAMLRDFQSYHHVLDWRRIGDAHHDPLALRDSLAATALRAHFRALSTRVFNTFFNIDASAMPSLSSNKKTAISVAARKGPRSGGVAFSNAAW